MRLTAEDRFTTWAAWQVVRDGVPPDQALAYMDTLRGSVEGQRILIGGHLRDMGHTAGESVTRFLADVQRGLGAAWDRFWLGR